MCDKPHGKGWVTCLTAEDYHDRTFQRAAPRKIPYYHRGPASYTDHTIDWDNFREQPDSASLILVDLLT